MQVGTGQDSYEWIDNWAQIPPSESAAAGWSHHGVVVTESDEVIAYHPGDPTVLVFDVDGNLLREWPSGILEAHGMALSREDSTEYLWIADPGAKRDPALGYEYPPGPRVGHIVKQSLDGRTVMQVERPSLQVYEDGVYSPTSVTVFQDRHGGNGDIWTADGYGESLVHRYDQNGSYIATIDGEDGAGHFDCPHSVWIDTRKPEPELYIADRANSRIQVYDLDGAFKRAFGSDFLTTPSAFATCGDRLIVAELRARLTVLDLEDDLVCYVGENEAAFGRDGWPNARDASGAPIRPPLQPGRFNSPHGVAADKDGNLYVPEWLISGRFTKLAKL